MQLSKEERIFIVTADSDIKNVSRVVQLFQYRFEGRSVTRKTVRNTVIQFSTHGTILNRNKGYSGRRISKRTQENMELVRDQIAENEDFSTSRHGTDFSRSTVCIII